MQCVFYVIIWGYRLVRRRFGDGEVDLEMIQLAGMGFAMQNAPDKVKKRVKHIAKSNDDEGILTTLITMGF